MFLERDEQILLRVKNECSKGYIGPGFYTLPQPE
jgi:hypothetical protein